MTTNTYIDELWKNHMLTTATRDKCVQRGIFTIKDLLYKTNDYGYFDMKGFTTKEKDVLNKILDKTILEKEVTEKEKPIEQRRLKRIISKEEQTKINELQNLFESSFINSDDPKRQDDSITF